MKQAAKAWNASKTGRSTPTRTTSTTSTKRRRKTAKKKKGRSRRNGISQSKIFSTIRMLALIAPAAGVALGGGSGEDKVARGLEQYTGYNTATQSFNMAALKNGWSAFVAATAITAGIPKLNKLIKGII